MKKPLEMGLQLRQDQGDRYIVEKCGKIVHKMCKSLRNRPYKHGRKSLKLNQLHIYIQTYDSTVHNHTRCEQSNDPYGKSATCYNVLYAYN